MLFLRKRGQPEQHQHKNLLNMRFLNLMFKNLTKSNMAKPEVHNLPTQFSENFRLFRDVCFSVYYIFIYFFLLFINVFSFLNGLEAIGSFIAFYQARSAQKVFQEL